LFVGEQMRLQEYMDSRCLSDPEMAELIGCPEPSLRRLRCGYSRPSLERAYRIEQVTRGEVGLADWQYPVRYPRGEAQKPRRRVKVA
jgi:transcriptional regulator with XRE-family HTH domain